jgi:hypothetical protein
VQSTASVKSGLPPKSQPASAFFAGLGSEHNSNSQNGTAMGINVTLGYDMNRHFALGVNAVHSLDVDKESTMESTVMLRYYLPIEGPYVQAEAGGSLNRGGKNSLVPQGGMATGWRVSVDKSWYLEPVVRGGYPAFWGTGVTVGKKFSP